MNHVRKMLELFTSTPALKGQLTSVVKTLLTLDLRQIATVDVATLQKVVSCCSEDGKNPIFLGSTTSSYEEFYSTSATYTHETINTLYNSLL